MGPSYNLEFKSVEILFVCTLKAVCLFRDLDIFFVIFCSVFMLCLEVWRERRVEKKEGRGEERGGE